MGHCYWGFGIQFLGDREVLLMVTNPLLILFLGCLFLGAIAFGIVLMMSFIWDDTERRKDDQ